VNVSYAVVTDPRRPLNSGLELALSEQRVWYCADENRLGCTENHLRAWSVLARLADESEPAWSVVLEDDAIPCQNFTTQVREMLSAAPGPIVSLYLGKGRPPQWQRRAERAVATNAPYILSNTLLHAVGVAVRDGYLDSMVRVAGEAARSIARKPIDEAITEWARSEALPIAYCNPSLVNHNAELPSLAAHRPEEQTAQRQRVAHNFNTHSHVAWYGRLAMM
jgi:GR25 family glycosyltransferase involved in LPS biosynthesis